MIRIKSNYKIYKSLTSLELLCGKFQADMNHLKMKIITSLRNELRKEIIDRTRLYVGNNNSIVYNSTTCYLQKY